MTPYRRLLAVVLTPVFLAGCVATAGYVQDDEFWSVSDTGTKDRRFDGVGSVRTENASAEGATEVLMVDRTSNTEADIVLRSPSGSTRVTPAKGAGIDLFQGPTLDSGEFAQFLFYDPSASAGGRYRVAGFSALLSSGESVNSGLLAVMDDSGDWEFVPQSPLGVDNPNNGRPVTMPAISSDGSLIAFVYEDDVYVTERGVYGSSTRNLGSGLSPAFGNSGGGRWLAWADGATIRRCRLPACSSPSEVSVPGGSGREVLSLDWREGADFLVYILKDGSSFDVFKFELPNGPHKNLTDDGIEKSSVSIRRTGN